MVDALIGIVNGSGTAGAPGPARPKAREAREAAAPPAPGRAAVRADWTPRRIPALSRKPAPRVESGSALALGVEKGR